MTNGNDWCSHAGNLPEWVSLERVWPSDGESILKLESGTVTLWSQRLTKCNELI